MNRRKIFDITIAMRPSMPIWPGDPAFERSLTESIAEGSSADVSLIKMGSHTGTHIDAPAHFLLGAASVDLLSIDTLIGEAVVYGLEVEHQITAADLESLDLAGHPRVLFKTRNSGLWQLDEFAPDFVSLTQEAAEHLIDKGVRLVGIDYLSVGGFNEGANVHKVLLENNAVIVEGLNLSGVEPGVYELICLPLKITGADGAPARVILREL